MAVAVVSAAVALLATACSGSSGASTSPSSSGSASAGSTSSGSASGSASAPASGSASAPASSSSSASASGSAVAANLPVTHPTVWLCRPGMANNPCEGGLDATVVAADGKTSVEKFQPATEPKIDCFYVYPTLSEAQTVNAPLAAEPAAVAVARSQASRFASVCRLFVPVYRQLTIHSIFAGGFADPKAQALASGDVDSAWHDYLNRDNHGRGVVLIGHSQGAGQVTRLIRSEIDKNPAERSRLVSALAIGGNVLVPAGKDVGGAFTTVPACRREGQTGCVVAYSSFNQPVPANSLFGRVTNARNLNPGQTTAGMQVLCVNPAALSGGRAPLQPYEPTRTIGTHLTGTPQTSLADLKTGFVSFTGLQAECRTTGGASWLQVDATSKSAYAQSAVKQALGPTWGLHLLDISNAYGNLVNVVAKQAAAWH